MNFDDFHQINNANATARKILLQHKLPKQCLQLFGFTNSSPDSNLFVDFISEVFAQKLYYASTRLYIRDSYRRGFSHAVPRNKFSMGPIW